CTSFLFIFFLMFPRPPISTLFPYTTLFRSSSIGVILPEDTHMNISYAAILNNANNVENAQKFINYLLDVEQQTIYMNENGEFPIDRKSTRLNSSHVKISYAVFCLKKKKKTI